MAEVKLLSELLSSELDAVGINKEMARRRAEMYKKRSAAKATASRKIFGCQHIDKVIVGSRREGIATETSDTDVLQRNHGVICSTNVADFDDAENKVCFLLECNEAPPGYVFLSMYPSATEARSTYYSEIERALIHHGNKLYLSSDKYMSLMEQQQTTFQRGWFGRNVRCKERKGPAIPKVLDSLGFETDLVGAFPASCANILTAWEERDRSFDWPSKGIVKKAAKLPVYVVAVGEHGSRNEDIQWRISFNDAEMILVQSLNDSQTKVLVIMRLLAKYVISRVCPDITSYVVKNVVFHVAEQYPLKDFEHSTLIERLVDCLKFLRNCVKKRILPNYMNPERNLFHGKLLEKNVVTSTVNAIDNILKNGKDILMFYLINKMKPEEIKTTYQRLAELKTSLERGNVNEIFAEKRVAAMSQEQLINLHVHNESSQSEFMLFVNELYYVYRPYVFKFGFRALLGDLRQVRPKTIMDTGTSSSENEELDVSGEHLADPSDSEVSTALGDDIEDTDPADNNGEQDSSYLTEEDEVDHEPVSFFGHVYQLILVSWYTLLWTSVLMGKFMMLNMIIVIHAACLVWMWYSLRLHTASEMTYQIDVFGMILVSICGISFIKKPFSEIMNVIYMVVLIAIWRVHMSYSDRYTQLFQEMIVMLDPQKAGAHSYRKAVLDTDDSEYWNTDRTYYA